MTKQRLPLQGIRVLDMTGSYAGPFCTMFLGDLGAEVVKVEEPERGDDIRQWGGDHLFKGINPWYLSANRNKKGLSLDIKNPQGREILQSLIKKADVFIVAMTVKALERLNISYEEMSALNQGLVYCTVTGYGMNGPYRNRPCYDLIAEGVGGIMGITGNNNKPEKVGTPAGDILTAHMACISILSCLYRRAFTGRGELIDVCLLDSVVSFVTPKLVSYMATGEKFSPDSNECTPICLYQPLKTRDGYLNLGIGNDRIWERVKKLLKLEDVFSGDEYKNNENRRRNRANLIAGIEQVLTKRETQYWFDFLSENGVPCGPIYSLQEVAEDPHIVARGMVFSIGDEELGEIPQVGTPWKLVGTEEKKHERPPNIGEHDEKIYEEWLGFGQNELSELRRRKIIRFRETRH
ncbi:MAG: CaiB/BaiF CoA transferase family protein [Bradyrhizobium sp.]